jgi:hypothetical protein
MLGFGGHFLTKARRYSMAFGALREARVTYRRCHTTGPNTTKTALTVKTTLTIKPPSSSADSLTPEPAGKPPETPSSPTPPPTKPADGERPHAKNWPTSARANSTS